MKKLLTLCILLMSSQLLFSADNLYFSCVNTEEISTRLCSEVASHPAISAKLRFQNDLMMIHHQKEGFTRYLPLSRQEALDSEKLVYVVLKRGAESPLDAFKDQITILYENRECTVIEAKPAILEILENRKSNHFELFPLEGEITLRVSPQDLGIHSTRAISVDPETIVPDKNNISRIIQTLVDFKTRYTYSDGYQKSAAWCAEEFQKLGLNVKLETYQDYKDNQCNVVAQKENSCKDKFYIVCAHLDSTSPQASTNAPGADDNASGCAGVIEIAKLLKDSPVLENIRFVLFGGEEVGIKGSKAYVKQLEKDGELKNVEGVIVFDMIGFDKSGKLSSLVETKPYCKPFISTFVDIAQKHGKLDTTISLKPWGSDHVPFLGKNIPCFLFIEDEFEANHNYHQITDLLEDVNLDLTKEMVRVITCGLLELIEK